MASFMTPAALSQGKNPHYSFSINIFGFQKPVWTQQRKRKYLALLEIEPRLLGYTAGSLVCIPTELSRLTLVFYWQRNWKLDGLTMKCAELPLISSEQTYTHAVAKWCSIQITIQTLRSNTEPYMKSMLMEE